MAFRPVPFPRSLFLVSMMFDRMPTRNGLSPWHEHTTFLPVLTSSLTAGKGQSNVLFPSLVHAGYLQGHPPLTTLRWACLGAQLPETGKLDKNPLFMLWHDGMSDPQLSHPHSKSPPAGGLDPARSCSENPTVHTPTSQHSEAPELRAKTSTLNKSSPILSQV